MALDPLESRGYRNKNPGNIDYNPANKWQGLDTPPIEPKPPGRNKARFCRFISHQYGIRAVAVLLITYQDRHGLRTPRQIISRWAPSNENATESYVAAVCRHGGWHAEQVLDLHRYDDLRPLVEAVIKHELGGMPYSRVVIDEGLTLAGVAPSSVASTHTAGAVTKIAAAGVGSAGVVETASTFLPHATSIGDLVRALGPWLVALIVVLVAGYLYWSRMQKQKDIAS